MKKIGSYNNFRVCLVLSRDTTIQMFFFFFFQRSIQPITSPFPPPFLVTFARFFFFSRSCGVQRSKRVFLEAFRLFSPAISTWEVRRNRPHSMHHGLSAGQRPNFVFSYPSSLDIDGQQEKEEGDDARMKVFDFFFLFFSPEHKNPAQVHVSG